MDFRKNYWEETYQRNIKKMVGICFRYVSDQQIAEDLAHDAFLSAMHKAGTFKGMGHFDAWLRKITVNTALMYLRDIKRKNENQQETLLQDSTSNEEEENMRQDFTIQELLEAINKLRKHHQLVFNLYVIDNYSHKQIATELDISEGTSKSHLARARKKLQQILNEKEQEKKRSLPFLLFPLGFGKIDKLYKKKFSGFEIETQNIHFLRDLNWRDVKQPKFNLFYTFKFGALAVGMSVILVGTILFLFNKKTENNNPQEKNLMISADTLLPLNIIDTTQIIPDTLLEKDIIPKQAPVVVKRERLIHKNIIVRDTLTIIDSTHAE